MLDSFSPTRRDKSDPRAGPCEGKGCTLRNYRASLSPINADLSKMLFSDKVLDAAEETRPIHATSLTLLASPCRPCRLLPHAASPGFPSGCKGGSVSAFTRCSTVRARRRYFFLCISSPSRPFAFLCACSSSLPPLFPAPALLPRPLPGIRRTPPDIPLASRPITRRILPSIPPSSFPPPPPSSLPLFLSRVLCLLASEFSFLCLAELARRHPAIFKLVPGVPRHFR